MVQYWPLNNAHCEDKQHKHEPTLIDRARATIFALREEEQGGQAKLLDIKPNKYMVNRFWEEKPAGVAGGRFIIDPSEKVFVQEIEQKEGSKREAIDDRRYDGIAKRDCN